MLDDKLYATYTAESAVVAYNSKQSVETLLSVFENVLDGYYGDNTPNKEVEKIINT
jgi:hypothetical protein